ncbi:MAG: DUF4132 domain-containing protein [Ruminococcus sp.]|nr:DUF4132 domain-containing protein [Ruminococcus sp.]
MLYNVGAMNFDELEKSLLDLGFYTESVKNGIAYLNPENERDDTLLENIKVQGIPTAFNQNYQLRSNFISAIKKEITRKRDDELNKRFILFMYALTGCYLKDLIFYAAYFNGNEDFKKKITDALTEKFGDDAEAVCLSIFVKDVNYNGRLKDLTDSSAETFLKAAEYARKSSTEAAVTAALIALDKTPLETDKNSDIVTKATEIIRKETNNGVYVRNATKIIAIGEAACFSDEFKKIFKKEMTSTYTEVINRLFTLPVNHKRILDLIADFPEIVTSSTQYVKSVAKWAYPNAWYSKSAREHLAELAGRYTAAYIGAMKTEEESGIADMLYKIISDTNPGAAPDKDEIREIARRRIAENIASLYTERMKVKAYLMGATDFESIFADIVKESPRYAQWGGRNSYCDTYGADDFVGRCITALSPCLNVCYALERELGFTFRNNEEQFAEMLFEEKAPAAYILEVCCKMVDGSYYKETSIPNLVKSLKKHAEVIEPLDVSKGSVIVRQVYLLTLGEHPEKYKEKILEYTNDSSKIIKNIIIDILAKQTDWQNDIINLLKSKKASLRDTAVSVIVKQGADNYKSELEAAFNAEKSDKLKVRIAALINADYEGKAAKDEPSADIITELTKNNKNKKVAWLFKDPYKPVRLANGENADDKHLQALLLCYSADAGVVNPAAKTVSAMLNSDDVEKFAAEVFGRWIASGAAAKDKWILYFASLHGGSGMISTLMHYIKEWSENMRGAIASDAVKALALNGSSAALMNVDAMARKFKNRQVKSTAEYALNHAAEQLGITSEELADRIVPDMGFDDRMCRTFDYGKRQFKVYLTPDLEIEIFNGEKKVKTMPKPGVNDDSEIAEKSYAEFKDMKKQMKNVVTNQKARLEYVLMCDRKWTSANWEKLFVKNPIMHCFAIGLIWGIYEDGKLVSSFRYLDDGSFTTSDEDEFEIPENAVIGLVHPIELENDVLEAWKEQLSDYEITQPFPQLSRQVFRMTEKEKNQTECMRFDGADIINYTLLSKLTKFGWYKGDAQDAGCFYEFYRNDVSSAEKDENGKTVYKGYYAEISFSGMYIAAYDMDQEEVEVQKLRFFKASDLNKLIEMHEVNERYFSEVVLQLTQTVGLPEE